MTIVSNQPDRAHIQTVFMLPKNINQFVADMTAQGFPLVDVSTQHQRIFTLPPEQAKDFFWAVARWSESLISPTMRRILERDGVNVSNMAPPHPVFYPADGRRRP